MTQQLPPGFPPGFPGAAPQAAPAPATGLPPGFPGAAPQAAPAPATGLPPGFPGAAPQAAPAPATGLPPGFPGAAPQAASYVAPPQAAQPPARGRYSGAPLPGTRYPVPEAPYMYDLEIVSTELVGATNAAKSFVWEFRTIQSNNPNEQPDTKHGYAMGLMFDSGYGEVAQGVLAALGCTTEAELTALGVSLEAIATACETQKETLRGRRVRVTSYTKVRGEKSKTPGKVDTKLSFAPIPAAR